MKKFIQKHYLVTFYLATLIFSLLLLPLHFIFESVGDYALSFTQFSPTLGVVFVVVLLKDGSTFKGIVGKFKLSGNFIRGLILAVIIPLVCITISALILSIYGIDFIPLKLDVWVYLLSFLAILVGSVAEEIGWRGFLLPNLQKKYSPFVSSLIVGVLWGIWHVNLTGGLLGFVLYTITMIEMSVLMTWLYNKTNKNLVLMSVWHLVFNLASRAILWDRFILELFIIQSIVFGVLSVIILWIDRKTFFNQLSDL